ncbi:MAG: PilZ domain-containing protein [Planctomycetota bacterium]|nr:PilZ domain-containing protein [Planctomycetota bacterium]
MSDLNRSVIREHERMACSLGARVTLSSESAEQVAYSGSGRRASEGIEVTVVDLSRGGAALRLAAFLPKGALITLSIRSNNAMLSLPGVVRRTQMLDRTPSYEVGLAFSPLDAGSLAALDRLTARKGAA